MTVIEHFAHMYSKHKDDGHSRGIIIKAEKGTYEHFRIACKYLCGANTTCGLNAAGVSSAEIVAGVKSKIIRYVPNMGITRRESGYALTVKGMKMVFASLNRPA